VPPRYLLHFVIGRVIASRFLVSACNFCAYIYCINGLVVHPRNFKHLCMGDKVSPCSLSNILDSWSRTVSRITCSCTAMQAESNKLFFVIIKCVFVEIFRKFQRHCYCRFSRDIGLQRLWEGPRHLLVINLMLAVSCCY